MRLLNSFASVTALAVLLALPAAGSAETPDGGAIDLDAGPTLTEISTNELEQWMAAKQPMLLIDARGPELFARGHLPGAVNVPADQVGTLGPTLPEAPVTVVYCNGASCSHSRVVGQWLVTHGREGVLHYNEGISAWRSAEQSVESSSP